MRTEIWERDDGWDIQVDVEEDVVTFPDGSVHDYAEIASSLTGRGYSLCRTVAD